MKKLNEQIQVKVNASISEWSETAFKDQVHRTEKYLSKDVKYIIFNLFLQIGREDIKDNPLEYKDRDNITIYLQPKIKNYVTFKSKENAERYKQEELSDKDLYLFLEVRNGKILI